MVEVVSVFAAFLMSKEENLVGNSCPPVIAIMALGFLLLLFYHYDFGHLYLR
jgi:hypothetical protein